MEKHHSYTDFQLDRCRICLNFPKNTTTFDVTITKGNVVRKFKIKPNSRHNSVNIGTFCAIKNKHLQKRYIRQYLRISKKYVADAVTRQIKTDDSQMCEHKLKNRLL